MDEKPHKDIAITAILAFIWFAAVAIVFTTRDDIPAYLLGVATVFFLMLVPSMKELVRSIERRREGEQSGNKRSGDE